LVFIYIVINLFDNLGKFLAKNATVIDIIIYYLYTAPSYIILLIPVAALMAVFLTFGFMTKNRELIALKMSGLNINNLFVTLLFIGVFLSCFTFFFQETVGVWAQTRMFEHKQEKIDRRPRRQSRHRHNFFYYGENHWVYHIRRFDGNANSMDNVTLWKLAEKNRIQKRIDAGTGRFDSTWRFENVVVREFDTTGTEIVSEYGVLRMPELQEKPEDFLKRTKPLEEMNVLEIHQFVEKRSRAGEDVAEEKVEFNYRFSYPIITIILLVIAFPISTVLKKGGIAIGLGISIVIAFMYWGTIQSCRAYGVAGLMNPFVAAWLPNIIFSAIGLSLMVRVPR
jgi:lipopolysaccharide export system permease protein